MFDFTAVAIAVGSVQAQVITDGTLSTQVLSGDDGSYIITRGDRAEENILYSFDQFSNSPGRLSLLR